MVAEMDLQAENKELLQVDDPELLKELEGALTQGQQVEPARKGGFTLKVGGVYVHSKYDPIKEARKIVRGTPQGVHFHFGLGLGYLLEVDEPEEQGAIVIFEPNPAFVLEAMQCRPLARMLRAKNARLCCRPERFQTLVAAVMSASRGYRIVPMPYHASAYPALWTSMKKALTAAHSKSVLALRTIQKHSAELTAGALHSLSYTTRLPGVKQLAGQFQNVPAVIVSAGPSLDRNLAELVPYKERILIFAIARTAKPLARLGIRPHFLVHNETKPFFRFIEPCDNLAETSFVLSMQAEPPYYTHDHGHTFVYQNPAGFTDSWIRGLYPSQEKGRLQTGGSVSTEAFSLAYQAGCNPIILVGQDLATKNGQYYGHGESNRAFAHGEGDNRQVQGYFGGTATSLSTYYSYALWLGEHAELYQRKRPELRVINATEGGVKLANFEQMNLREALWRFCGETLVPSPELEQTARMTADQELPATELAALVARCQHKLEEVEQLSAEFKQYQKGIATLQQDPTPDATEINDQVNCFEEYKARYVASQQDMYVLSGFMQAELIEGNQRKRATKPQVVLPGIKGFAQELAWEVTSFAHTLASTSIAVARMRPSLHKLAQRLESI